MEDTNGQVRRRGPERRISQPTSTYIVSWDLPRLTAFSVEAVNYAGEGPCRTAQDLKLRRRSAFNSRSAARQLRVIAAQEDTSTQALIEQAIEMLFRSRAGATG